MQGELPWDPFQLAERTREQAVALSGAEVLPDLVEGREDVEARFSSSLCVRMLQNGGWTADQASKQVKWVSENNNLVAQLVEERRDVHQFPPVLNEDSLFTKAAPFGDVNDLYYYPPAARIACNYTPSAKPLMEIKPTVAKESDSGGSKRRIRTGEPSDGGKAKVSRRGVSPDTPLEQNGEEGLSDGNRSHTEEEEMRAYADAIASFQYYVLKGISDAHVEPPKEEWLRHVMELLPQEPPTGLSERFYFDFLESAVEEMREDYYASVKSAILEYVLMNRSERERLKLHELKGQIRNPWHFRQPHVGLPDAWRDNVDAAQEDIAWSLQTLSPNVLELASLWEVHKHRRPLDVSSETFVSKQPWEVSEFRSWQSHATETVRSALWASWVPKCAEVFRHSPPVYINGDADAYYRSVAVMQSNELRELISDTLAEYVSFFETHRATPDYKRPDPHEELLSWSTKAAFRVNVLADLEEGCAKFSPALEEVERQVLEALEEAVVSVRGLPQVHTSSAHSQEGHSGQGQTIPAVPLDDDEVVEAKDRLSSVVRENTEQPRSLVSLFDEFVHLIATDPAQHTSRYREMASDLDQCRQEIERLHDMGDRIRQKSLSEVRTGLFLVDLSDFKEKLQKRAYEFANQVLESVRQVMLESNSRLCDSYAEMHEGVLQPSNSGEEVLSLKRYIQKSLQQQEELRAEISVNKKREEFLYHYQLMLPEHDFHVAMRAYEWPKRMQDIMKEANEKANSEHRHYEDLLRQRRSRFQEQLNSIQEQIDGLENVKDIENRDKYAEQVRDLSQKVDDAQEEAAAINAQEKMFGWMQTKYHAIQSMRTKLDPFHTLWTTVSSFYSAHNVWMTGPFSRLNPEQVEDHVNESYKKLYKLVKAFSGQSGGSERPEPLEVAKAAKEKVEDFQNYMELIQAVCNPGLRERHWQEMSDAIGFQMRPDEHTSLQRLLDRRANENTERLKEISDYASREYSFERLLDKMESEWEGVQFELSEWKDTGTYILKGGPVDEAQALLDDHLVKTQAMQASPFSAPFSDRLQPWDKRINRLQEMIDEWLTCQSKWIYLEPIFGSEEIMRQIPKEGEAFHDMDSRWRKIMERAKGQPKMIELAEGEDLLEELKQANRSLDVVEKGLNDFLETKKLAFPRFFFLSNDELLEILSEGKDPIKIQPYMKKCFEAIDRIEFTERTTMTSMISVEGEKVALSQEVDPARTGAVEQWMLEFEDVMKDSVHKIMSQAVEAYMQTERENWIKEWPGQVVLAGSQVYWTQGATDAMQNGGNEGLQQYEKELSDQLGNIVERIRGDLTSLERKTIAALVVLDVHNRDVIKHMVDEGVEDENDFNWMAQLRYYWEQNTIVCRMINAQANYGYEYLGNSERLVITPLTDRCYRTLMSAIHLNLGGAPAGPAGTGKTETVKDLSKAVAIQCVVFNCSDGLDYKAMAKFFKGLAASGAWACFDEFNRIELEVLSVVAQQVLTIQRAVAAKQDSFSFEGADLRLIRTVNVFITMNPGYAGRSELPDNLKALFRDVAMMVPDYAQIAEIILFSNGYLDARNMARKLVQTYRLCSEQLSAQDHYDYGMRAVISVLRAAGNLKRTHAHENEDVLMLRAITDVNLPKFLDHDVPLFNGILSDLFPDVALPEKDYGNLLKEIRSSCESLNLQPLESFETKAIQLYEMILVRHGLMLVGSSFGMKSTLYKVLADALSNLNKKGLNNEYHVKYWLLNPKAVTMGQLFGIEDPISKEWQDGVLAIEFRNAARDTSPIRKWVVLDGPVDAIWIENMNTVLDDNKKLCLNSGEIIAMSGEMNMIFEVDHLAYASPATVSRCGMVYVQPSLLGWRPLVQSWLQTLPGNAISEERQQQILHLFDWLVPPLLRTVTAHCSMPQPMLEANLVESLIRLYDSLLDKLKDPQVVERMNENRITVWLESFFLFSLVWSLGASVNEEGRRKFDVHLRKLLMGEPPEELKLYMKASGKKVTQLFPEGKQVFDFVFDQERDRWISWLDHVEETPIPADEKYQNIIVTTRDTVRYNFLLSTMVNQHKNMLFVGPTGTGKTVYAKRYIEHECDPEKFSHIIINFSAQTSANMTQDIIEGKLDKRKKNVYGPPYGKSMVILVDDLNMPLVEQYGAQPPIELLRQCIDHGGWFDRKDTSFKHIQDLQYLAAMGPPGGGRNYVTQRYLRHYSIVNVTPFDEETMKKIFTKILNWWMQKHELGSNMMRWIDPLVTSTIRIYETVQQELLPTPTKSHYTFNLRDVSKVFQGMCGGVTDAHEPGKFCRLWVHELQRVFSDRLVDNDDAGWMFNTIRQTTERVFKESFGKVLGKSGKDKEVSNADLSRIMFCDFLVPGQDPKVYTEVSDSSHLVEMVNEYLGDYNATSKKPMHLIMFEYALNHISRICRMIRQPGGHALLVGVGGSGRQSLTRLAAYIEDYDVFQVEISKSYGRQEWADDLKKVLRMAGESNKEVVFLFADTQINDESFVEDVSNILNTAEVPNLLTSGDLVEIFENISGRAKAVGQHHTRGQLYNFFLSEVKRNLHIVLAFSPVGNAFRERLRKFPSLVNCTTIDWFSSWPEEGLKSVAESFLKGANVKEDQIRALANICVAMHKSVKSLSQRLYDEMRRYFYATPTSFLELISSYKTMLKNQQNEKESVRQKYANGLEKLERTEGEVTKMQEELEELKPKLIQAQKETEESLKKVQSENEEAEKVREVVQKDEQKASEEQAKVQQIKDETEADLKEAKPVLEEARKRLNDLQKSQIDEIRRMSNPPHAVRLVLQAVCILKGRKPARIRNNETGRMEDDYWETSKKMLADGDFLNSLMNFDTENIPTQTIEAVGRFVQMKVFEEPDNKKDRQSIINVSEAAAGLAKWVKAVYRYDKVAKEIQPKFDALEQAQKELEKVNESLAEKQKELQGVEDKIAGLQQDLDEKQQYKEKMEHDVQQTEIKLDRAQKLIQGLGGEKSRWKERSQRLADEIQYLTGDMLLVAAFIAYLGAFSTGYRNEAVRQWIEAMQNEGLPCTSNFTLVNTIGDPVKIRQWNIQGLPKDEFSSENAIIMDYGRRWPFCIDPQGQANKFIREMEKENGVMTLKLSDPNYMRNMENSLQFGKPVLLENAPEQLDATLDPVLHKETFKQSGTLMIRIGDANVEFSPDFRLYITSKLRNPHLSPELCTSVSLINFMITQEGLEDQLLGTVVAKERPDLAEQKNELIVQSANNKKQLKEIEDRILDVLHSSKGNVLEDEQAVQVLNDSKTLSNEITEKQKVAEETERRIDETRSEYRVVAWHSSHLFFCVADMSTIEYMYQYSLSWFIDLFIHSIETSESGGSLQDRLKSIREKFTFDLYESVCRSTFEKDKLLFAFLLVTRLELADGTLDGEELRFFLTGGVGMENPRPNPAPTWLPTKGWDEVCRMSSLQRVSSVGDLASAMEEDPDSFRHIYDSNEAHRERLPEPWDSGLGLFQKMMVIRCIRFDKVVSMISDYVSERMGSKFVEPLEFNLSNFFEESSPSIPLVFILSQGSDPLSNLFRFAETLRMRVETVSLGQGQGPIAEKLIDQAAKEGYWVVLQNCHLAKSFMPRLEALCEGKLKGDNVHKDFRLWLTSYPSSVFPMAVLENSVKMTSEAPKGLRAGLLRTYMSGPVSDPEFFYGAKKEHEWRNMLFGLAYFHTLIQERRHFGPVGFNIPYDFNENDLRISVRQLRMFLDEFDEVPFETLKYTCGECNYGGKVTDANDRRTLMTLLNDFYCPGILQDEYPLDEKGRHRVPTMTDYNGYVEYIKTLPVTGDAPAYGLHENAEIAKDIDGSQWFLDMFMLTQSRVTSSSGQTMEEAIDEVARGILERLPDNFDIEEAQRHFPVDYYESMNTVLVQELVRVNALLDVVRSSLQDLRKAIGGLIIMSEELEAAGQAIFDGKVPELWKRKSFPSLKPLGSYMRDLQDRCVFFKQWSEKGTPSTFPLPAFFFTQAFLTSAKQNYARKYRIEIEKVDFDFEVLDTGNDEERERPDDGVLVYGIYFDGCEWDYENHCICEPAPKKLVSDCPMIWMQPCQPADFKQYRHYDCPLYKTPERRGVLSTTGHSTNHVTNIRIPSQKPARHWIKRGVAMLLSQRN